MAQKTAQGPKTSFSFKQLYLPILILTTLVFGLSFVQLGILILARHPLEIKSATDINRRLARDPLSIENHLDLAAKFLELNNPGGALEEIAIARSLGASVGQTESIKKIAQQRLNLRQLLITDQNRWRQIVATRSGYRDGWYQLAVLAWLLGDTSGAQQAIDHALVIDPYYEPASKLRSLVNESR